MALAVVSGVPGVGASAVCERARRRLDDVGVDREDAGIELINFGDVMLEHAAARGLTADRDDLAALSPRDTRRLQRRAAEYVADRRARGDVLLTTHLAVETDAGVLPGLPGGVLEELAPDRLVLVEAEPSTVVDRRDRTDRAYPGGTSARRIAFQQDLERAAAVGAATRTGAPVRLVENEGDPDAAAAELVAILEGLAAVPS